MTPRKQARPVRSYRMSMGSNPHNIHRVEDFLGRVNRMLRLNDENFHVVLLAVTEAVNNSIVHGNKRNAKKKVYVTCVVRGKRLIIRVRDEGEGFDPHTLPDPLQQDNLLRESGRGVFLMKQLMESVEYRRKGTEVEMTMGIPGSRKK